MSIENGNRLSRSGRFAESIREYRKVSPESPLFAHAQFNIKALESSLREGGEEYNDEQVVDKAEDRFLEIFGREDKSDWTAVITLWKRNDYLKEQLGAIFGLLRFS